MTVYIGESKSRRRGKCDWCKREDRLTYTVYVVDSQYHAAVVCDKCMSEYQENLRKRVQDADRIL